MPKKSQVIQLSDDEYIQLRQYVREGKKSSRAITRARVLLLSDEHVPDEEICQQLDVGRVTVYRIRSKYHDGRWVGPGPPRQAPEWCSIQNRRAGGSLADHACLLCSSRRVWPMDPPITG